MGDVPTMSQEPIRWTFSARRSSALHTCLRPWRCRSRRSCSPGPGAIPQPPAPSSAWFLGVSGLDLDSARAPDAAHHAHPRLTVLAERESDPSHSAIRFPSRRNRHSINRPDATTSPRMWTEVCRFQRRVGPLSFGRRGSSGNRCERADAVADPSENLFPDLLIC